MITSNQKGLVRALRCRDNIALMAPSRTYNTHAISRTGTSYHVEESLKRMVELLRNEEREKSDGMVRPKR